ncbi:hypothetical protein BD779DRAFT_1432819 [Infundibulicybe gibba]|nr:hypothetical protein BD779DRAFT_1432819 [Infundibulicybe gibba]
MSGCNRGKRRVTEDIQSESSSSSLSPVPETVRSPPKKRTRRAEIRTCPICDEPVPLRLLGAHAELEAKRVETIIKNIGSTDILTDTNNTEDSSRSRRSALKARQSLTTRGNSRTSVIEQAGKTIQGIKRRRKQRHVKLREMIKDEDEDRHALSRRIESGQVSCPVCLVSVRGDEDVIQAHVDACLADENRRLDEQRQQRENDQQWRGEDVWEETVDIEGAGGHVGDVRGTGFHTRDRNEPDVDEEIDVDGDDETFGEAQFTEGDILITASRQNESEEVETQEAEAQAQGSLRDLVADGKVMRRHSSGAQGMEAVKAKMEEVMGVGDSDRVNLAVLTARNRGDKGALIVALGNKIKQLESLRVSSTTSLLCRICLDPYNEPTTSTGCWHTCCRECWLRCLGSTKLCPICKRITGATDLRRIYL